MSEEVIVITNAEEARTVADSVNKSKKDKANEWVEGQENDVLKKVADAAKLGQYDCSYEWTLSMSDLENMEASDSEIIQNALSNRFTALGFKVSVEGWLIYGSTTTYEIKLKLNWSKEEEPVE